jgi:hypothetical protein
VELYSTPHYAFKVWSSVKKEQGYFTFTCILSDERGDFRSTPLQHLRTKPNIAASVGTIFGTPVVEQHSLPWSHIFGCLQYHEIFIPLRQTLFFETAGSHSEPNQGSRVGVPFQHSIFGLQIA